MPAIRDHIKVAVVRGPPQYVHLHNQALLDATDPPDRPVGTHTVVGMVLGAAGSCTVT
jgi:hypothetical protein